MIVYCYFPIALVQMCLEVKIILQYLFRSVQMFTYLALIVLICQFNFTFTSGNTTKNVTLKSGRMILKLSKYILEQLIIHTFENHESYINVNKFSLKTYIMHTFPPQFFGRFYNRNTTHKFAMCMLCKYSLKFIITYCRLGGNVTALTNFAFFLCNLIIHLLDAQVCRSLVILNRDIIIYVVRNNFQLTAKQACAIVLQPYSCYKKHRANWHIYIPPGQSTEKQFSNQDTTKSFEVLQLTDIHIDSMYTPGATTTCGKPLCCQSDQINDVNGAGYWADYQKCDMPWHTMEKLFDNIRNHNNQYPPGISYVYFTGDIISHRIWQTSRKQNTKEIQKLFRMMKNKLGDIPVFPVIGNHESHPLNQFSPFSVPEKLSTQWLYDLVAEEWSVWLPESALETVRMGGFYTVSVKPGFRIIVLNSNVCYTMNWWLLYENGDLYGQLQWLVQQLKRAEEVNEVVHILSHIPSGDTECVITWSREFRRIVERFAYTITAQFNGHTHFDELKIFYNTSNLSQPIGVAYNGGSFTTFEDVNPNYKTYSISSETFRVTDSRNWIFHVPIANFQPQIPPRWFELYSFKTAYELETLELYDLNSMVETMAKYKNLLRVYYRFKVCDSETGMTVNCDEQCMKDNLCSIVTTVFEDDTKCNQLINHF